MPMQNAKIAFFIQSYYDYVRGWQEKYTLTLKEPGYFDPSHSRGGGADSAPP